MVVANESENAIGEAAELAQKPPPSLGVLFDQRRTPVCESGPGRLRISSGMLSLPMSCSRPPTARSRSRSGGEPELVPHLHRAQRDPARVLLRVRVLLCQVDEERSDVGAEERLLFGDEIGAA